ncbi:MAG TPA: hypothetical protein VHP37_02370 [Burkholderiales bacterium]|nr:hypothetical protein [Burkholderiales bacterium]
MATKTRTNERANGYATAHEPASVETFLPEIRSDVKWRMTKGAKKPFAVPNTVAPVLAVWNFGVPFGEMDSLHLWLRANEIALAGQLTDAMKGAKDKVYYRGTYLNVDAGSPMYQTWWEYSSDEALETESPWTKNKIPRNLRDLIVQLRAFWVRDPGRSESRFGLASNYANLKDMKENPFMLQVTVDAAAAVAKRRG